jgi:glycosyltransferase involved in cell wall biosynthesis
MPRSVVVWGGPPYFGQANSPQEEMAKAFRSLGCDVLYLELEGDGAPFRNESRMSPGPVNGTAISGEGVIVARIRKLPLAPYAMVGSILNIHIGMALKQLRWLEPIWQDASPTLVLYGWFAGGIADAFSGARIVYDCIDEHRAAEGIEGNSSRVEYVWNHERKLLESSSLTVCVSDPIAEDRRECAKHLTVVPNGSDIDWCKGTLREPESIRDMLHPRALFMGRISSKVDVDLIRAAALKDSTISWILAGEVVGVPLVNMPQNVRQLGKIHHDDIAPVAAHCDIGVAPLKPTTWNRASSPMKYADYLSAGLPIVSTPLPAAENLKKELADGVVIAEGTEAFLAGLKIAAGASDDVKKSLREYAGAHTWKARAEAVLAELDKTSS